MTIFSSHYDNCTVNNLRGKRFLFNWIGIWRLLFQYNAIRCRTICYWKEVDFVTRTRSSEDNRVVIVALTPAGEEIAANTPLGGIVLLPATPIKSW